MWAWRRVHWQVWNGFVLLVLSCSRFDNILLTTSSTHDSGYHYSITSLCRAVKGLWTALYVPSVTAPFRCAHLGHSTMATIGYLGDTTLQALDGSERKFKEARGLSSLKPQLDDAGFRLYAVVHELLGVDEFRPYFDGVIYFDSERRFYGPHERWSSLTGLFSSSVWKNIFRARGKGIEGNMKGEGRLMGGLFVLGPASSGILFEYQEKVFGDHANHSDILAAVNNFKSKSPPTKL